MQYKEQYIDNISFYLKENKDFSWIKQFGKVIKVFDEQDSGHICFIIENNEKKVFIKYAGAKTINYTGTIIDAINLLKTSAIAYQDLKTSSLVNLIDHFPIADGYALMFDFVEGESLYKRLKTKDDSKTIPYEKFKC